MKKSTIPSADRERIMFAIEINKENYEYDIQALVKSFYPEEQIAVLLPESRPERRAELADKVRIRLLVEEEAGCGEADSIAGALSGVCEALTYAKEKGLDLNVFSKSVATGAAGSRQFDLFGPKIIEKDYAPGFFMKHFIKDMKLALIEANRSGLNLEVLSQVLAIYEELEADGNGDLGTQALIKYYE